MDTKDYKGNLKYLGTVFCIIRSLRQLVFICVTRWTVMTFIKIENSGKDQVGNSMIS